MLFIFHQNYDSAGADTMDKTGEYLHLSGQSCPVGRNGNPRFIPEGLGRHLRKFLKYPAEIEFVLEFEVPCYFLNAFMG